ncbi:MAG TPA: glycosyltransferase, partial [Thermodesulfobacteriota bacterium]|nr:glycosyltransferase [Thermodesulfobacteriota bacterium]
KQVGLPVGKKIVCYAGNLYVGRGINLLTEVALRLKDVLFVIVGGVEEDIDRYMYVARMKSAENVIFIGFVPHKKVSLYLSSADVLVMPYTSQMTIKGGTNAVEFTSPIKLFEYMAARRPIVATSLPSVEEILEQEGNAVLVEPDSVDSLYYGIKRVLDDEELARDLSFRAVNDITKYTWEERARKILEGL